MELSDSCAVVLVIPLLLDLNNLVGAVCEDHASFPLGVYAALRSSLNQKCDVVDGASGGVGVVNVAVYNYHLNVSAGVRAGNHIALLTSHGVPLAVDSNAIVRLGAVYLAGNNGSLLNEAVVGAVVASSSQNNVVVLLNAVVPIPVIGLELGLGSDGVVALLEGDVDVVRAYSGNLSYCEGLNVQDGVIGRAVGSEQLNLGRLHVSSVLILGRRVVAVLSYESLDVIVDLVAVYVYGGGLSQIVLGAVQLNLYAVHLEVLQDAGLLGVVLGSVNAVNLGLVVVLVQNGNHLVLQVGVVLLHVGEVEQSLVEVVGGLVGVVGLLVLVESQLEGLLAGGLGNVLQNSGGLLEVHELLANGLVVVAKQSYVGVSIVTPYNGRGIDCVVDQLSSVLTRARTGEGSVNILEQAVLVSQSVGLGCPVDAYQACLVSVVAEGYEQHLSSFLSSYGLVRCKLGCRLASDDADRLAVLDEASGPVAVDISKAGLVIVVRRSVRVTSAQHVDHLRHLRTSYGVIGLERTVGVTVDYAQLNESVHDFILDLDVGLIRERRTGKHSERASERQYQCENLFEIAGKIINFTVKPAISKKSLSFPNFSEKSRVPKCWNNLAALRFR